MPYGYCQCGCGGKAPIAAGTDKSRGWEKGKPVRFIHGHRAKLQNRDDSSNWKGGRITSARYVMIWSKGHPQADSHGYVQEHILVAEKALGHYLPSGAVIHHVNKRRHDNQNSNLVVCQDQTYHMLIHARMRALEACGNANWIRCAYCKSYSPRDEMRISTTHAYHPKCASAYNRAKYKENTNGE